MDLIAAGVAIVRPGDTLVVAFTQLLSREESDEVVAKIRKGLPPGIEAMILDGVTALAVAQGSSPEQ